MCVGFLNHLLLLSLLCPFRRINDEVYSCNKTKRLGSTFIDIMIYDSNYSRYASVYWLEMNVCDVTHSGINVLLFHIITHKVGAVAVVVVHDKFSYLRCS
jgi:hypothetical protein